MRRLHKLAATARPAQAARRRAWPLRASSSSSGGGDDGSDAAKKPAEPQMGRGRGGGRGRGAGGRGRGRGEVSREQLWRYEDALLSSVQVNPPDAATTHETAETPDGDMLGADWESSSTPTERDLTYLTRRRRQGSIVAPEEYDFQVHQHDRERPHELLARLDRYRGDRPRCDKKAGFHLIDPEQVHAGNLAFLSEYVTEGGMIAKRHQSRLCARCQRRVRKAVKRARSLGLIPTDASFDAENTLGFPDDVHKCHVSRTM